MCGFPCSGKSTRAAEIQKYFESQGKETVLVNEEFLNIDKKKGFSDSLNEKMTRGAFLSSVERLVTEDTIVICDSLNYIKGYRYELHCRARSQKTPQCIVYCDVSRDDARKWNEELPEERRWDSKLFEELCARMEVPNPRNRWDKPLFVLKKDDPTPCEEIMNTLFDPGSLPTRNVATELAKVEEPNFLYEMDQVTQAIINALMDAQQSMNIIGEIPVPKSSKKVVTRKSISAAELRRLRRQFIKIHAVTAKAMPISTV